TVADSKSYECVATNEAGSVSTTFKTFIRQKPQVVGVATKKVNLGTAIDIECRVVKGRPKPNIRWFVDNSGKQFVPVDGSLDVMHIARAENTHTGRYKCVVQNEAGTVEHVTSLTVESRPDIVTKSKSVEAIEGDVAIKIPCNVVGVPRPTITWKLKGAIITPNTKYSFDNGSLVILNPNKIDIGKYTCEAKNYLGSASSTTDLTLEKRPSTFGTTHFVYLLYGENRNIECDAYRSKSQSIKWFDNEGELKQKSIQITKATVSNDGNYTCHVSDKHGHTETHTYVVDVGGPPKLLGDNPLNDWRGGVQEIRSNCDSDEKPPAKVQWKYNGKVIPDSDVQDIGVIYKWGHYSCNVSNPHGSVLKDFDVKSSVCLIPKNLKDAEYMPLVLDDKGDWPTWETSKYFSVVEQEEKITLSCPNRKDASNSFKKFPSKTVLKAYCDKEDVFIVDGKRYKLSDLQCTQGIQPTVAKKNVKCLTGNSELIKVGYNTGGFLESYEVCFDKTVRMPRYIRNIVTAKNDKLSSTYAWHTYPGIENSHNEKAFTCKNKLSSCCYAKSQLVEAEDFKYAAEMNTTFIDPLNVVPAWRPCSASQTSWESVNKMVREQMFYDEFVVWSGTDTWQKKDGAVIPRYLWKVIRFDDDEVFAIIHVNDRTPTDSDIKCRNVCNSEDEPWFKVSDKYTYCCSLSDFLKAFEYHDASIGGPLSDGE
ncbi:hemicentin-2-like, partial [Spodoptera litura]|uniref:Hemolin n=1 Tax=Spodoptera litura TaxID=69820 RepID=A0A9J7EU11_SPOLT